MRTPSACLLFSAMHLTAADEPASLVRQWRGAAGQTDLTVAGMEVSLPPGTGWNLEPPGPDAPVTQLQLKAGGLREVSNDRSRSAGHVVVLGIVRKDPTPFAVRFLSSPPGRTCVVTWDPSAGISADYLAEEWAGIRARRWVEFGPPPGSITDRWGRESRAIYTTHRKTDTVADADFVRNDGSDGADPFDTLAVFGGRCAVTETLQLRDISANGAGRSVTDKGPVAVSSLPRVEVKSHPFAEMAAKHGGNPPSLELAGLCPPDRFFAWLPQPRRIRTVVDRLGEASGQLSAASIDGAADYQLWRRTLNRMGLTEESVRTWLSGNHAESVAFTLPDLFIRDGTDITFLIRMKEDHPPLLFAAMPEAGSVIRIPGATGEAFVARRGKVLIASTSREEAEAAVKLADNGGKGSLGESDELRCMRQRLPDTSTTVAWSYFSDPFIRRLTGPEVKIGQHRRAIARNRMESLTSAALLHRLDHGVPSPDVDTLIRKGYAAGWKSGANRWDPRTRLGPDDSRAYFRGYSLTNFTAHSEEWGSLANLQPLGTRPVTTVSPEEAAMYRDYVTRYSDFWRRYFDPIAIRLEEPEPGTWQVDTLVLPLVENSLYSGLRSAIDSTRPAAMPQLDSPPVAALAFSLKPETVETGGLRPVRTFTRPLADVLTGRIALAVPDSDPVLQAGGLAGLRQLGSVFSSRNQIGQIGLLISMLTRPIDLFLEVRDGNGAASLLEALAAESGSGFVSIRSVTTESDQRRIYVIDFDGFAEIHLAASVENGWLHLTNHPWTGTIRATGTEAPPADGASAFVRVNPGALKSGNGAAVFQAGNERRSRIRSAAAELAPWLEALGISSDEALDRQFAALGLKTPLPDGLTVSSVDPLTVPGVFTGSSSVLSAADAAKDPGILAGIRTVDLSTRFDEDGLHATLRWKIDP